MKIKDVMSIICLVGFFAGLLASFGYISSGQDLKAIYYLGLSAFCYHMM